MKLASYERRSPIHPLGFHGDSYLLEAIGDILPRVDAFVETGTNMGSTARWVARRLRNLPVFTCEPDSVAHRIATRNLAGFDNIELSDQKSPEFLSALHQRGLLVNRTSLYLLDAHGVFIDANEELQVEWSLPMELEFLTEALDRAIILVDDVKVPAHPEFQYCCYNGIELTKDFIMESCNKIHSYQTVFPDYREKTSPHHPLCGYMLLAFGVSWFERAFGKRIGFRFSQEI